MEESGADTCCGAGFRPCLLDVDDRVAVVVEDVPADHGGLVLARDAALAPASLDDRPEVAFEGERASLAVLALLGAEADDACALVDVGPFEREDLAAAPAAEVGEPAWVFEVLREVGDDTFVLVVLEEALSRVALGELADVGLRVQLFASECEVVRLADELRAAVDRGGCATTVEFCFDEAVDLFGREEDGAVVAEGIACALQVRLDARAVLAPDPVVMLQMIEEVADRDAVLAWSEEGLEPEGVGADLLQAALEELLRVALLRARAALAQFFPLVVVRNPPVAAAPALVDSSVATHGCLGQRRGHVVRKSSSEFVAIDASCGGSPECRDC